MTAGENLSIEPWPVVIVGAGPVGLLLANLLGQRHIRCLLLEKRTRRLDWSRAIGVTPPSLNIFRQLNLHRTFGDSGVKITKATVHDDFGHVGDVSFDSLNSRFNFILSLPQSRTMEILQQSLAGFPAVTWYKGVELTGLKQNDQTVQATLRNTESERIETVPAQWLIGCDGSDSTTRELAARAYVRKQYHQQFVMADYPDTTGWKGEAHLFFSRQGSLESFPLPDNKRRWITMLTDRYKGEEHQSFLLSQTELLSGCRLGNKPDSPVFHFTPEKIIVDRLISNRIILAGDAAHVMSPIGGQGMNTGFADAESLAGLLPELLRRSPAEHEKILSEYNRCRQRAADIARRRAAFGMWVGTRTGRVKSFLRAKSLRLLLRNRYFAGKLPPHFAMLNIPGNQTENRIP